MSIRLDVWPVDIVLSIERLVYGKGDGIETAICRIQQVPNQVADFPEAVNIEDLSIVDDQSCTGL